MKTRRGYLAGNIMSHGDNLARQEEYEKFMKSGLDLEVYSPVMNKSINDKKNMTEEENNKLAEKITKADIERLWNADFVTITPEQNAIGTLTEMGCLYGWKYMANKIANIIEVCQEEKRESQYTYIKIICELKRIIDKVIFAYYQDIRTNHLNEKDWRRSFSINQLLYGMVLDCTTDNMMNDNFDDVLEKLKKIYGGENNENI